MRLVLPRGVCSGFRRSFREICGLKRKAKNKEWEAVIGLEIHAQLCANSKLFSGSAATFGAPINDAVSFFDASLPGTLPVLNKACVNAALRTALALDCSINRVSYFDRKHYFYADLPAGYQITQKRLPLASGGYLMYLLYDFEGKTYHEKVARLTQIQLEHDSGKSLHDVFEKMSLIDLNRAGIGLMEIITEPDFRSAEEVVAFVKELQLLLHSLGSCNAKMEEGSMRVDASVSVRKPHDPLGVRTEVKNLNSIRSLGQAIDYEIERQITSLENGIPIENQTMFYDVEANCTVVLRDKEKVHDYRFMPEPNLVPLHINDNIEDIKKDLPMLPREKRNRLVGMDGLSMDQSIILVSFPELLALYERCSSEVCDKRLNSSIANFCINDILALVNKTNISLSGSSLITNEFLEVAVMLFVENRINLLIAKKVLEMLVNSSQDQRHARLIVKEGNMELLSDANTLKDICVEVLENHGDAVSSYRSGNKKVMNFLIGKVQKVTGGRADGKKVNQLFQELISK